MTSRRAAVLGSPIAHSRSPLLHRAAYDALGLDWRYDAIEVTPEALPGFLAGCHWPEWAGLSLTMPLKSDVLPLVDAVSETASIVQAANTVIFGEDRVVGDNTDVSGIQQALALAHGEGLAPDRGIVIGSGATARSALVALARMGTREIQVLARNPERARDLGDLGSALDVHVDIGSWQGEARLDADVVIATVPPGAADHLATRIPERPGVLLDVAYGAEQTPLVMCWREAGGATADGLDLLLWQAVDQVRLMTGREPPVDAMRAALRDEGVPSP
jgi:shikimate dehydrogenase